VEKDVKMLWNSTFPAQKSRFLGKKEAKMMIDKEKAGCYNNNT
jgi:hypothetical protein